MSLYLGLYVLGAISSSGKTAFCSQTAECGFDMNVEAIAETVKDYVSRTGFQPAVTADYLQIITPIRGKQLQL